MPGQKILIMISGKKPWLRERSLDEILPWDFIDTGVSRRFLEREWQRAKEGVVTENCRQKCSACGAMKFKGGVCLEGKN